MGIGSCALIAAIVVSACGKKGPPLAPIVHIPAAVERIDARRRGSDVVITLTVPSRNVDQSMPADVGRIEVYGYTGLTAPSKVRFLDVATLVGTVKVLPLPDPAPPPDTPPKPGELFPGGIATLQETLTSDTLVAKALPPPVTTGRTRGAPAPPATGGPTPVTAETGPLRRFYLALAFSPRGRLGPPGTIAELPLTLLPDAPHNLVASHTADAVMLEWEPSGGLIGFLLERPLSPEPSPLDDVTASTASAVGLPDGMTHYNVYREIAALPGSQDPGTASPPEPLVPGPLNTAPLDALTFSDPLPLLDARERCYTIRAVRGSGERAVEGEASERVCVMPTDDFPPAAPVGLQATSGEGAITLIWEPNAEPDLAGYLVLRGEVGDATLSPLTDVVITEARFTDRTVRPGVRYVYAVQAIDTRLPKPNVSAESARAEETAR